MKSNLKFLLPLLLSFGCSQPEIFAPHALSEQILKPRVGHEGKLTNRTCARYEDNECKEEHISEYDLADAEFRKTANKLDFICNLGGHRYKICMDQVGFCRITYERKCFIFCWEGEQRVDFVPASKYQFLLDSNLRCFNKTKYPFEI